MKTQSKDHVGMRAEVLTKLVLNTDAMHFGKKSVQSLKMPRG